VLVNSQLVVYDLIGRFPLPRCCSVGTVFCMVERTKVLCIGGWDPDSKEVYWLDLGDYQTSAAAEIPLALGTLGLFREAIGCISS